MDVRVNSYGKERGVYTVDNINSCVDFSLDCGNAKELYSDMCFLEFDNAIRKSLCDLNYNLCVMCNECINDTSESLCGDFNNNLDLDLDLDFCLVLDLRPIGWVFVSPVWAGARDTRSLCKNVCFKY